MSRVRAMSLLRQQVPHCTMRPETHCPDQAEQFTESMLGPSQCRGHCRPACILVAQSRGRGLRRIGGILMVARVTSLRHLQCGNRRMPRRPQRFALGPPRLPPCSSCQKESAPRPAQVARRREFLSPQCGGRQPGILHPTLCGSLFRQVQRCGPTPLVSPGVAAVGCKRTRQALQTQGVPSSVGRTMAVGPSRRCLGGGDAAPSG